MTKHCNGCGQDKELTDFYKKPRHKTYQGLAGYSGQCKPCDKAARAEYVRTNPDKLKNSDRAYRLNKYGLTPYAYNLMLLEQDGKCKGCDRHQSEFKKRLAVDHCHKTGAVRGLLCTDCNLTLGHSKDSIKILTNLIKYLSPELADQNTNVIPFPGIKKVG